MKYSLKMEIKKKHASRFGHPTRLYASSTCGYLQLFASPFCQDFRRRRERQREIEENAEFLASSILENDCLLCDMVFRWETAEPFSWRLLKNTNLWKYPLTFWNFQISTHIFETFKKLLNVWEIVVRPKSPSRKSRNQDWAQLPATVWFSSIALNCRNFSNEKSTLNTIDTPVFERSRACSAGVILGWVSVTTLGPSC